MLGKWTHHHPWLQPREGLVPLLLLVGLVLPALALLLATTTTRLPLALGPGWEGILLPRAYAKHTSPTCTSITDRTRVGLSSKCLLTRARFQEGILALLVPDMTAATDQARLFASLDAQGTGTLCYGDLVEQVGTTGEGRLLTQVRQWREMRRKRAQGHLNVYGDGLDPLDP